MHYNGPFGGAQLPGTTLPQQGPQYPTQPGMHEPVEYEGDVPLTPAARLALHQHNMRMAQLAPQTQAPDMSQTANMGGLMSMIQGSQPQQQAQAPGQRMQMHPFIAALLGSGGM